MSKFAERCYKKLKEVPEGKVTTYKELARAVGTKAYRAVGTAMKHNPNVPIVPCHRVVKSNGELGGYLYGAKKKARLLKEEGVTVKNGRVVDFESCLYSFR